MKLTAALFGAFVVSFAATAAEQNPAPAKPAPAACSDDVHRQFDFWAGEWTVTWNGKVAGVNRIEKILNGCALLENWSGSGGYQGKSLNFYDSERGVWHQTWIDYQGNALGLDGEFAGGKMTLIGKRPQADGTVITHRITWTPNPEGALRQVWDSSTDDGKTWAVQFDGFYSPKK